MSKEPNYWCSVSGQMIHSDDLTIVAQGGKGDRWTDLACPACGGVHRSWRFGRT